MKKKSYIIAFAAACLTLAACQPKWEMIPPPQGMDEDSLDDEDFYGNSSSVFFVSLYGDGDMDGSTWENALDIEAFYDLLKDNTDISKATFYLAEGKYLTSGSKGFGLTVNKSVGVIMGGFSQLNQGTSTGNRDMIAHPTVFTGDVNGNNKADDGDCCLMKITGGNVSFNGCIFENGYIDATYAEADKTCCSGFSAAGGTLNLTSCIIRNCISSTGSTAGYAGGPAVTSTGGLVRLRDCEITGCRGESRGGAVRTRDNDKATVFMDRCSIHDCSQLNSWGNAIQNSQGTICLNNCTLYNNGGSGAQLNGGGPMIVVNSTIVGNSTDNYGAVRVEASNGNQEHFINSLMFSLGSDKPSIVKNRANDDICSKGWCAYSYVRYDAGNGFDASSDIVLGSIPSGTLQNGVFVWNPKALSQSSYAKASELFALVGAANPAANPGVGADFANWVGENGFGVDQRNNPRDTAKLLPGSYDNSED